MQIHRGHHRGHGARRARTSLMHETRRAITVADTPARERTERRAVHTYGRPHMEPAAPVPVVISDDPQTRLAQSESFWQRNPGYMKTGPVGDLVRGVMSLVPGVRDVADWFRPTRFGDGQAMLDQMLWQIRSGRQPHNPWWMPMNAHLVAAGLEAEAALRAGRSHELRRADHRAWLGYLRGSDHIRQLLAGTGATSGYTTPGSIDNRSATVAAGALSDAWKGASLLNRLEVALVWRSAVRRQYWIAHDETIQAGKHASNAILAEHGRAYPQEAQLGSAWAHTIKLMRWLNPPAAGHSAIPFQLAFLPQMQPLDSISPTLAQRMFVWLIRQFDPNFDEVRKRMQAVGSKHR